MRITTYDGRELMTRGGVTTHPPRPQEAFSLIELLMALTIIAILSCLVMAAVSMVRQAARALKCANGLGRIATANLAYASDFNGMYVPGYGWGRTLNSHNTYDVWTKWWINPIFTGYIDGNIRNVDKWPTYLLCESAKPNPDHVGKIGCYYGYMFVTGSGIDFEHPSAGAMYKWRTGSVLTPSESMMFDDATDYIIKYSTNRYINEADAQSGGDDLTDTGWGRHITATRHRNAANCAYFDGHVQKLAKNTIEGYARTDRFWNIN